MLRSHDVGPESTFLVSGGGRGITAACVVGLARAYRCRFILLGRTTLDGDEPAWAQGCTDPAELKSRITSAIFARGEKPSPPVIRQMYEALVARREVAATLRAVEAAGGQAEYVSADVTDGAALAERLHGPIARLGPVSGLIHGSGRLADKRIERKTAHDFDAVFGVKVRGLENLLACVPPEQLRHLVLFSSAAGFFGNPGQTDYAIANEILNKVAHRVARAHPACRVISFNWGPWDGGMVTPEVKALFADRNIDVIPVDGGVQALVDALAEEQPAVQILVGSALPPPPAPVGGALRSYRLRRRLTLEANPFLRDHIIGGHAVLPIVCSMAWFANAAEALYPGFSFFAGSEHRVLKGITFDESLADEHILDFEETSKTDEAIELKALVRSTTPEGKERYHYGARIELRARVPDAPICDRLDLAERDPIDGAALYQDGTFFHGPAFQGVERVLNVSPERVTMRCISPIVAERDQGQFPIRTFNPFLCDVQFQSMLVWARRHYGAASIPLSDRRGEYYRSVPPGETFYVSMDVLSHSPTALVVDIAAHDEHGRVYTLLFGAEVTLSERLNAMFTRKAAV